VMLGAGSALWGTIAEHVGIPQTLLVAALSLALGLAVEARYPVGLGEGLNFEPSVRPEPIVVESWGEHLRQHERATIADRQISELVNSFHLRDLPPIVSHLLYAYYQ